MLQDGRRARSRGPTRRSSRTGSRSSARTRTSRRASRAATRTLTDFYDSLPRVRRALANVPTYMVDRRPRRDRRLEPRARVARPRVHGAARPPGRSPTRSSPTSPSRTGATTRCATARARTGRRSTSPPSTSRSRGRTRATTTPARRRTTLLEKLFGLNQPDPEEPAPQLKWHFSIDGPRHRVLVLDTRTRRVYRSRYLPPGPALAEGARGADPGSARAAAAGGHRDARRRLADAAGAADDRDAVHRPGEDAHRGVQAPLGVPPAHRASSPTTRSGPATTSPTRRCSSGSPSTGRSSCSRARCTSARAAS